MFERVTILGYSVDQLNPKVFPVYLLLYSMYTLYIYYTPHMSGKMFS